MIPILYEKTETGFSKNGIGRLRDCISCVVTEERNGIYECDFQYPISGENYDLITPGRIIGVTHDDTGDLQPFDIVGYERPIDGVVTFHAVHISYRLSGQVVWDASINSLSEAIDLFNNVSNTSFHFYCDFSSNGYMSAGDGVPRTVRQMMGGIEGSVLDTYGGEWGFDKWRVWLYKARGVQRDFTIRYGVNMLDYNETADYSGAYNAAWPYWVGTGDNGSPVVVRGNVVDSNRQLYNGRKVIMPLDLTEKFENKPSVAQLDTAAETYMDANRPDLPAQTISVNFFRLQDTEEFAGFAPLMSCALCDTIKVAFPAYDTEAFFKIVKTEWDVLTGRYIEMELGQLSTSMSEALGISTTPESVHTITDFGIAGDLTVGDDASIVGDLSVGGGATVSGDIVTNGDIRLNNAKTIYIKDTGGTPRSVVTMSTSNNTALGYGGYNVSQGGTFIYGNNVRIISRNAIQFDQPLAALYKVTTVTVSVAALSAHANVAASSYTMTAQSGYNAVGIVGWSTGSYRIRPTTHYIASNTSLYAGFANTSAAATSQAYDVVFRVLWLKATSA